MVCGAPVRHEDIYKIYAESFRGANHLRRILEGSTGHRRRCAGAAQDWLQAEREIRKN
jgi:hypothetical protein